ncbi:hypothetical protein LTR62_002784 [Meristemomyces frigidus]|uniref:CBM21 domain-containing protein n=1 Tax=Meristemomyces frigidus TaxID=1508187 RepID=A0AAN7TP45_9PEZI|nr:hypothetical protein LTR62_002784 [Meristemomyces frigidus]
MPYTPPASQSPASSTGSTPAVSRTASYHEDVPRSPVTSRPQPPRSNSASYLHKHRRSPSLSVVEPVALPTPTEKANQRVEVHDFGQNSSVRQSPPPVNNLRIPTGMVLSPPESPDNSDGDEVSGKPHSREDDKWNQLKHAVSMIDQRRTGSPDREGGAVKETISAPHSQTISPSALSQEARKISHSRSSTETAIIIPKSATFESPVGTSDDSDDDDQGPLSKPSLVRKKSGELVKPALRPSSRRRYSSMPGTPTYNKSVHFNDNDNQTRHFLQVDKPMAVSAGSSPVESYESESEFPFDGSSSKPEREIRLPNFPEDTFERRMLPVRVERIFLSQDRQTLVGSIAVQNISFHKLVVARFTLDHWTTTSEIVAEYNNDPRSPPSDGCDRFNFHVKLSDSANIDTKTLFLCVKYTVNGQDYWDNNNGTNFQIDFVKSLKVPSKPSVTLSTLGARPRSAIPRSRHSGPNSPRGRQESVDDDFARSDSAYHFGATSDLLGEAPGSIKLKPRSKRGSLFPTAQTNGLGGRYDFGTSLSMALVNATDKLGRQSGLLNGTKQTQAGGSYFAPMDRADIPEQADQRPDSLTTDRPAMGSDQYKDLVQKFCYFTPGAGKPLGSPLNQIPVPASAASRANDVSASTSTTASSRSSGNNTPTQQLDGSGDRLAAALVPYLSQAISPAPVTGHGITDRATSSLSFGYPYLSNRNGYLYESHTPQAIHG